MRVLGVDFGSKRIGIALGETEGRVASPRPALVPSGKLKTDALTLTKLAQAESAEAIALGIPDYADAKMANICRRLASEIEALGYQVHLVDESFTSVEAESVLLEMGFKASHRKRMRDGEAACRILDRFFEQQL